MLSHFCHKSYELSYTSAMLGLIICLTKKFVKIFRKITIFERLKKLYVRSKYESIKSISQQMGNNKGNRAVIV